MIASPSGRSFRRGAVLALALALVAPGSVAGAWQETVITSNTQFDEPAMVLGPADDAHVAYIGFGDDPGIYYATDASGDWVSRRLTTATDDAPAIAIDETGGHHIVFVRSGTDPGIMYATDRGGDWVVTRLSSERVDSPSIAIDAAGGVHIAFNSDSFEPGIISMDDVTGRWRRTQVTEAHLDGASSVVVMPDGSAKIAFARYAPEEPGIHVASAVTPEGPWAIERLTSAYDDEPSMATHGTGAVELAFVRFQADGRGLYRASGPKAWTVRPLVVDSDRDYDRPSLAIGGDGRVAIAYSVADSNGDVSGIFEAQERADGGWDVDQRVTGEGRPDDWPSLALDSTGRERVAYAELDTGPNPGVYVRDADAFDLLAASTVDSDVSMIEIGDDHVIAFKHLSGDGDRGIRIGRETNGTWAFETASKDPSAPSVVVDDAWHARIFTGDSSLSDATGPWLETPLGIAGHAARTSPDPSGGTLLAFTDAAGQPAIASDRDGRWETATGFYRSAGTGAVAGGPDGRIHWVIAGDGSLIYQSASDLAGPWTETRLGEHAADPSVAVDADGAVHVVWRRTTSDEGTYHTTNASGSWVTTRLTRTSAEGAPSLALDETGHLYVAVIRSSLAASPGVYLLTNRTGAWSTTRIDGVFDDMDPQIAVSDAGRATIVLGRDRGTGLLALEGDASAATVDVQRRSGQEIDIGARTVRDRSTTPVGSMPDASSPPTVAQDHASAAPD